MSNATAAHTMETNWREVARELGARFEARAAELDHEDAFVADNYRELKEARLFAALVPPEFGGEGVGFSEMCDVLRILGGHCGSTALAFSMHTHLVAANVWKHHHGQDATAFLHKVGAEQPVLVSTGGRDWLESNGTVTKVDGGYRVSATKVFASQSAVGEILVTSAPYDDPDEGWQVLHFAVPFASDGLKVLGDWKAHGMRSTGSHTVKLEDVFVPDEAITLRRPRGEFHPFFNIVSAVALTLVMSVYLGIAERAADMAITAARGHKSRKRHIPGALGEMHNSLTSAQLAWEDMRRINDEYGFAPVHRVGQDILTRKTLMTEACIATVTQAMEVAGGQGFFRTFGLERLLRDVQAAKYHPYPAKEQHAFRGDFLLADRDQTQT